MPTVTPQNQLIDFLNSLMKFLNCLRDVPPLWHLSPRPPTPATAQIRQNSGRKYVNKEVCIYIPMLKPLKTRKDSMFKDLHKSQEKNITSLLFSRQKPEGICQQYSVISDDAEHSNSEMNKLVHASQYANDKYTLKSSKARKGKEEVKFKHPGSTNDDDIECDVIEHDNDATIRDTDVNKLIARKRYAPKKHSFVHPKEFLKSTLSMCRQSFTQVAVILAVVISILRGGLNMKLPKLICTSGLASVECESGNNSNSAHPLVAISFLEFPILTILRESTATITNISKRLCSCIRKVMFLNNSKPLTRCMKVLQNTIIRRVTIFPYY